MIVSPTVCFCMLFFVSPFVWKTFAMMFLSTCFYYLYCRYLHLRFCKPAYYTTNRLDTMVNHLWGVPLSVVAAACCTWGIRSGLLAEGSSQPVQFALIGGAFCASLVLWLLSYRLLLNPWAQKDVEELSTATFEDVKADLLYTWFNCNPVYTLKCEYYLRDAKRVVDGIAHRPGVLKVKIDGARGLRDADWMPFAGTSEPFCVAELVGKPRSRHVTPGHQHGHNPVWHDSAEFIHYSEGDALTFTVYDKDVHKSDDVLGHVTLSGDQVCAGFEGELELDAAGRGVKAFLKVTVTPPEVKLPQTRVHIRGATGLRDADWGLGAGQADPFCICEVVNKPHLQLVTPTYENKANPAWGFTTGLDLDSNDTLVFTVMDQDFLKKADCLGTVTVTAEQLRSGLKGKLPLGRSKGSKAFLEVAIEPPHTGVRDASSTSGRHPLACGEDPNQVRCFEVGKEYLFVRPERQHLVERHLQDCLEFETHLEHLLHICGHLTLPCRLLRSAATPKIPRRGSRELLVPRSP